MKAKKRGKPISVQLVVDTARTLRAMLATAPHAVDCIRAAAAARRRDLMACNCWRQGAAETVVDLEAYLKKRGASIHGS